MLYALYWTSGHESLDSGGDVDDSDCGGMIRQCDIKLDL